MHETTSTTRTLADAAGRWFFDEVEAVARGETPDGTQVAMIERSARCGAMPPLLRRDVDEVYRLIEGEVTFFVDDYEVPARAGDVVVALRDVPRAFRVASESARWLVLTRVSSLDRFHDFGRAVAVPPEDPVADWASP